MDYEVNDNVRKYDDIYYRRMKWKYFKKSPPLLSKTIWKINKDVLSNKSNNVLLVLSNFFLGKYSFYWI